MSALPAILKVRRDKRDPDTFLISLDGFHCEGEGQLVARDVLDALFGSVTASALICQVDDARPQPGEAA